MPSKICLVALMGRENNPLYVRSFIAQQDHSNSDGALNVVSDGIAALYHDDPELRYYFLAHVSLDVFAARLPQQTTDSDFGLLFVQDGIAMYGWITNTGVKIVLGFPSGEIIGNEIRSIFLAIQFAYISLVCNPFYVVDEKRPISSKKFEQSIRRIVDAWNGTTSGPQPIEQTILPASSTLAEPVMDNLMNNSQSFDTQPANENIVMTFSESQTAQPSPTGSVHGDLTEKTPIST
ncbi:Sedlin, N-terminal conserved region-domain-containing protein [Lipomyces japonicus]|uniref:Sedlin, N-terminal conserved region-domain-containing protein n=1 Tax=Lipomyces japonicus TaxID=56871 RepID=UPI0034CD1A3A